MADLTTLYPQQQGGDLYRALDFVGWDQRNQQFEDARQNNSINQRGALAQQLFDQQMNPLKLQQQGLNNDTLSAQLPGVRAQSTLSANQAQLSTETMDQQKKALVSKYAAEISDNELKDNKNRIKTLLTHPDAKMREIGKWLWELTDEVQAEKMKLASHENVARINAAAGVQRATISANKPTGSVKPPKTTRELMTYYDRMRDEAEPNSEEWNKWNSLANAQWEKIQQEAILKAAAGQTGKVNVEGATGGQVPVNPPVQPTPNPVPNNPNAASPNPSPAANRRVRVVSPDGKVGTIPANQLQDAIKQGYKQQ